MTGTPQIANLTLGTALSSWGSLFSCQLSGTDPILQMRTLRPREGKPLSPENQVHISGPSTAYQKPREGGLPTCRIPNPAETDIFLMGPGTEGTSLNPTGNCTYSRATDAKPLADPLGHPWGPLPLGEQ